jgi:type II secretory pathway pseudopilin PulG
VKNPLESLVGTIVVGITLALLLYWVLRQVM